MQARMSRWLGCLCLLSATSAFVSPNVPAPWHHAAAAALRHSTVPRLSLLDSALDWLDERLQERRRVREGEEHAAPASTTAAANQRPKRIILVRHGQSEGNADKNAYGKTPDSQIALTERGYRRPRSPVCRSASWSVTNRCASSTHRTSARSRLCSRCAGLDGQTADLIGATPARAGLWQLPGPC